jgi:hypothetical protein
MKCNQTVLRFLTIEESKKLFFNEQSSIIINYLLKKVLFSQPEIPLGDKPKNIQITKEFLETWIAQAFDLTPKGAGNYPIDVYSSEKKFGFDVKFVSSTVDSNNNFSDSDSNETSIAQNFANEGKNLDTLFDNLKFDEIMNLWKDLLIRKNTKAKSELHLNKIYYAIFIRGGSTISLAIAELHVENITYLKVNKYTKKSVFVDNFIDNNFGNVKIYRSKKRMELRVKPLHLYNDKILHKWDFSKIYEPRNLQLSTVIHDKKSFYKYIESEFKKLFLE